MAKTTVDTLVVKIESDLSSLKRELGKVNKATANSSKKIGQSFSNLDKQITNTVKGLAKVGVALGAVFAGIGIKKVIDTGMEIESLKIRLEKLFKSTTEGAKAFEVMADFAGQVPFSLGEIQRGAGNLAVVAKDATELGEILKITGNVAAVTGLDFATASSQIQRSFAGGIASADIFREKGVRDLLGFSAGATVSAEETKEAFSRVFGKGGEFGQVTDDLANTLSGTLSMIGDKVFNFQRLIADEGFFQNVTDRFQGLNELLDENQDEMKQLARTISLALVDAMEGLVSVIKFVNRNSEELVMFLKALVAGFIAMKAVAIINKLLGAYAIATGTATTATLALNSAMKKNILFFGASALISGVALFRKELGLVGEEIEKVAGKIEKNPFLMRGSIDDPNTLVTATGMDTSGASIVDRQKRAKAKPKEGEVNDFQKLQAEINQKLKLAKIDDEAERRLEEAVFGTTMQENLKQRNTILGLIKQEIALEEAKKKIEEDAKEREKQIAETRKKTEKAQKAFNDKVRDANSIANQYKSEQQLLNEKITEFKTLLQQVGEHNVPFATEALTAMENELHGLNPTIRILEDNFDRAFDGIAQSIADAMTEGKDAMDSFKDVARAALNSIIRDFIRLQMTAFQTQSGGGGGIVKSMVGGLGSMLGGIFGGSGGVLAPAPHIPNFGGAANFGGGQAGSTASFMMGGSMSGRAGGGRIAPDMPTLVGERGAELFVPNTSGKIVPKSGLSNALGGNQTIVNQTINVSAGVAQTIRAEMMNMLPSFKQETIAAVAESRLRGGQFASAFTGA
tara:strand:- start:10955 stop:13348 length:2394 start_codon:yes stop_codon:yes gene_type:complete